MNLSRLSNFKFTSATKCYLLLLKQLQLYYTKSSAMEWYCILVSVNKLNSAQISQIRNYHSQKSKEYSLGTREVSAA